MNKVDWFEVYDQYPPYHAAGTIDHFTSESECVREIFRALSNTRYKPARVNIFFDNMQGFTRWVCDLKEKQLPEEV